MISPLNLCSGGLPFLNKSILVRFITKHGRVHYKLLDVEKNDIFKEIRKIFDVIRYDEN